MADYYGTDTVVSELREDGLLIIRINRPDVANALNGVTSKAMENIMNNAETDPAVRAIIVTGTGKVFCAGEDLSELSEGGECQTVTEHGLRRPDRALCSKPVIAACNGSAAGGGMEIRPVLRHGGGLRARQVRLHRGGSGHHRLHRRPRAPRPRHQPQGLHGASAHRARRSRPMRPRRWASSTTSCRPRKSWTRPSSWPKSA